MPREIPDTSLAAGSAKPFPWSLERMTNAFSKKWHNLKAAYAVWFAFYNFCRVHKTLRITPTMAAGITDHIWSVRELIEAIV
jgi:hypothetical protein